MKLYRIYGYLEVQVEADSEEEALELLEEGGLDGIMDVMNVEEVE